ncbi:MAG: hypothetical protein FWH17_01295 [Oscillospiraceae bacterium]|nr:hypothetical protein [Oscillospiraceae bacterium]
MKKLLAIVLVAVLALALSAFAFAADPIRVSGDIGVNGHTRVSFKDAAPDDFDWSKIVRVNIRVTINNWDDVENDDIQLVLNSATHDWGNIGPDLNQWGNVTLDGPNYNLWWDYTGLAADEEYFEIAVGCWNPLVGSFVATAYTQEMLDSVETGAVTFVGIAVAALAVSGTGAVVIGRKIKK